MSDLSRLINGRKKNERPDNRADEALINAELERYRNAMPGVYQKEDYVGDVDNAMAGVKEDGESMQVRRDVLQQMLARAKEGYTDEDRAAINMNLQETNANAQAQRASVLQNMAARGMSGGGAELAAQLGANQQAQQTANNNSLNMAAMARQNALQAMMNSGTMARGIGNDQWDHQSQVAQAQNAIGMNNQRMKQAVQHSNVNGQNNFNQQRFENQGAVSGAVTNRAASRINERNANAAAEEKAFNDKIKGYVTTAARVGAGIATGGASEAAIAAGQALKSQQAAGTDDVQSGGYYGLDDPRKKGNTYA